MVMICQSPFFMKTSAELQQWAGTLQATAFFILFNVTISLAMKNMIVVERWNEVFPALEKPKVF